MTVNISNDSLNEVLVQIARPGIKLESKELSLNLCSLNHPVAKHCSSWPGFYAPLSGEERTCLCRGYMGLSYILHILATMKLTNNDPLPFPCMMTGKMGYGNLPPDR